MRKVIQITFAFELRAIAHIEALGSKDRPPVIVLGQHSIQALDVIEARMVERRAVFDQLFVPGFDLGDKGRRLLAFRGGAEQLVLLLEDVVVLRDGVQVAGCCGDDAAVEKAPAL